MTLLTVRDLMSKQVTTVNPNDDLNWTKNLMSQRGFRHLPVVDESGHLVGLVTDRDLRKASESSMSSALPSEQRDTDRWSKVSWIMTKGVLSVPPDAAAREAACLLREYKYGCLPVVDRGQLVGIVTEADFVTRSIEELGDPGC